MRKKSGQNTSRRNGQLTKSAWHDQASEDMSVKKRDIKYNEKYETSQEIQLKRVKRA